MLIPPMEAVNTLSSTDSSSPRPSPLPVISSSFSMHHDSGPIIGPEFFKEKIKALMTASMESTETDNSLGLKMKQECNNIHTSSGPMLVSSKALIDGFKPFKGNVTVSNGRVQFIINNPNILKKSVVQEKVKDSNEISKPKVQCVSPNDSSSVPSVPKSSSRPVSKVVMSTVSKRVPLVSHVGNCSKAPAFAATVLPPVAASPQSVPATSVTSTEDSKTSMSILEARLTAPVINRSLPQNGLKKIQLDSGLPLFTTSNVEVNQTRVLSTSQVKNQCTVPPSSSESVVSQNTLSIERQEVKLPSSEKQKLLKKKPLAVLSYEKGLTRFVPVRSRSVVLVDVGVQVALPNPESGNENMDISNECGASPLPAVSSGLLSVNQGTSTSVTSSPPLKPGQFVTVNPKTGKMVIAIPKHFITSSSGSKTLLINGKPVKVQLKKPNSSDASLPQSNPKDGPSAGVSCNSLSNVSDSSYSRESDPGSPVLSSSHSVPVDSSFGTPVATLSNSIAPSSKSIPNSSAIGESPVFSFPLSTLVSPSSSSACVSSANSLTVLPSSSVSVLLNSEQYNNRKSSSVPSSLTFTSLSTETVTTPSIQSPLSLNLPTQIPPDNGNSIILPLNSPIHSPSKNASVHTIPNTTSLFILIPNSPMKQVSDNSKESDQAQSDIAVLHTVGDGVPQEGNLEGSNALVNDLLPLVSLCPNTNEKISSSEETISNGAYTSTDKSKTLPVIKDNVNKGEHAVHVNQLETQTTTKKKTENAPIECVSEPHQLNKTSSTVRYWNTMDTIMNTKLESKSTAQSQINNMFRSAFHDFKDCLILDKDGNLPIHTAVAEGNEVAVKRQCVFLAARRASVNLVNKDDETPLQLALLYGHSAIVKILLSRGADATVMDKEENSTLHLAVLYADHVALEALLQSKQFDKIGIDIYNDEGFTPLHLAAQRNKVKHIHLLFKFGCEIDTADANSGRTALFHAIEKGSYKAQQALVRLGADMREPTFFGSTPLFASKSDVMAQLASGQHTVGDIIESDDIHIPRKRRKINGSKSCTLNHVTSNSGEK